MPESHLLMEMTWPEIAEAIARGRVLIFCVGTVEQHGPHLPVGVDIVLPMEIASRVAARVGGVVAPCTNYGYKSLRRAGGGPHFPGSVGMRGTTVISMVADIIQEFIRQGWRRLLVLDWHLENVPFVHEGVEEALRQCQVDDVKVVKVDNPNGLACDADPGLQEYLFGPDFPGWSVEHAAIWETSAMMALCPSSVRSDQVVDGQPPDPWGYDILPSPQSGVPASGVFWKATAASREKGERIVKALTEALVAVVQREFGQR